MEEPRNFEKETSALIDQIISKEKLEKIERNMESVYLEIYMMTKAIHRQVLPEGLVLEKNHVNIREIANYFHISVIDSELNSEQDTFINEISGYLDVYDYEQENYKCCIYVNRNIGELSKRYVIAHELSHYFWGKIRKNHDLMFCVNPFFPRTGEEQICDIMSSFFLMPITTILEVLGKYIVQKKKDGKIPVDEYDWMRYLSYEMKISEFHVTTCYQNVRYLGGLLYNKELGYAGGKMDEEIKAVKEHPDLFPQTLV